MYSHTICRLAARPLPCIWILHEWWDDKAIEENLKIRNIEHLSLVTVKKALAVATRVVTVCSSQRELYSPKALCDVIFVGVLDPFGDSNEDNGNYNDSDNDSNSTGGGGGGGGGLSRSRRNTEELLYKSRSNSFSAMAALSDHDLVAGSDEAPPFTFLCLGIVCPRKNQCWTVEAFQAFCNTIPDAASKVRLVIVGARESRVYEIEYLQKLRAMIKNASNIEVHDVTNDVEQFFQLADCLIITSLNEVTPMVISEAFSYGIPVISTDIAGIKEMYEDGKEGFLLEPGDIDKVREGG